MEKIDNAIKIFQAYKEGKTIEINWQYNGWQKCFASHDLFYALNENLEIRIAKEPTYRPYASAEEFLKASNEHGHYIKFNDGLYDVPTINKIGKSEPWRIYVDTPAYNGLSFEDLTKFIWQDGTPCGILEHND